MPRVPMTPTAKIVLYGLRVYLILLLVLVLVRFIRTFIAAGS